MLPECFVIQKDIGDVAGRAGQPACIDICSQRVFVPAAVGKPERDIIGELDVPQENGHVLAGVDMVRASPVQDPVYAFGEDAGIVHLFYECGDLVVERELGVFKDGGTNLKKIVHQVGVHLCLFNELCLVTKTSGDAVIIGLPEKFGIFMPGYCIKEGQGIGLPLLQLLDQGAGKGE